MSAPSSGTRTVHMIEAVADRFEGAPRQLRRRWSDEFKAQAVAEALEPGARVSAIAHGLGIRPLQLFGWRRVALNARKVSKGSEGFQGSEGLDIVAAYAGAHHVVEIIIGNVAVRAGADN